MKDVVQELKQTEWSGGMGEKNTLKIEGPSRENGELDDGRIR